MASNPFNSRKSLSTKFGTYTYYSLQALVDQKVGHVSKLPYSIKVLLEAMLRNVDGFVVTDDDVVGLANWNAKAPAKEEIPFMPGRVVLQDFTGVPCVVDLAAMRDAMKKLGGDPNLINPLVKCDLVIDHSVQVDAFASKNALTINGEKEFERNNERYKFLKWGQQSLNNFSCVPPATGIVHQVNLEYLAGAVLTKKVDGETVVYPDSCVGTDSHTTMINGLGVVGWGVGGIEAEAVMLGQPIYMLTPDVIGFRLKGKLPEGATATDLVLTVTQILRKKGVVDKFVEFFGDGLATMTVSDRATIANMAPEYGATMGFFPIDAATLDYMRLTGRSEEQIALVEAYCKANGLFWTPGAPEPEFTDVIELDMSTVQPSLAGPKRPQDRVELKNVKSEFFKSMAAPLGNTSFGMPAEKIFGASGTVKHADGTPPSKITHGAVVIAAITSCTNTSNPDVMLAAGLVARKARSLGLTRKPWVKTSLAPGSRVVTDYYNKANLTEDLEALGFHTVGYGCTTCIGNSGPLPDEVEAAIKEGDLCVASVLSGNRNFEGRVHQSVKANFLASPPLVVAYAIAGSVAIDLATEPLGVSKDGKPVFLKDIWPSHAEVAACKAAAISSDHFKNQYSRVFTANDTWNAVPVSKSDLYAWDEKSTYIQNPPYFDGMGEKPAAPKPIQGAKVLAFVGDSVTTDHISPAGDIAEASPAGQYLKSLGVRKADFNSYGSRRGNDRVMTRGTYANVRIKNNLAIDPATGKIKEGGWTKDMSNGAMDRAVAQLREIADLSPADAKRRIEGLGVPANLVGDVDNVELLLKLVRNTQRQGHDSFLANHELAQSVLQRLASSPAYIYDAAMNYKTDGTPLIVLAGKDYGMGSSRDWAAKGTLLLGCRAVISESFERIHRSNLVGMGVLPLCFEDGQSAKSLGLTGDETFDIHLNFSKEGLLEPRCTVKVTATKADGKKVDFNTKCRIDTPVEAEYYRNGGVLHTVLRRLLNESKKKVAVGV
ncbi:MAG TPA: aconitate hydratase AcnA [Phycisphaerales bacterium]|nr:aconitate hydratase AcnA [Phycisphaerales bacterium]